MKKVCVAVVQMCCYRTRTENIEAADALVREAAAKGAQIILLPELFETWYFCQEKNYSHYKLATSIMDSPAVNHFSKLAKELRTVLPISFYEKCGNTMYNSLAAIDADGKIMGTYRKTHIPDDHFYQEKFYFSPGNTGFKVWETAYARIGVGICWDQWFPEAARSMALNGAELLLYPSAIGSEPIIESDSVGHWRRCMQGHGAANMMPVLAANRIGTETVSPVQENNYQSSTLDFYGSSFIADETGAILAEAGRTQETILQAEFDLDAIEAQRFNWGLFRDRRPECYDL